MENKKQTFDIVQLIEQNPINTLSKTYQSKLLNKIKEKMHTNEQQIFVTSFYSYLNFSKDDFVVDLDDVWQWIGFLTKGNAKKTLGKNFAEPEDYKILLIQLDKRVYIDDNTFEINKNFAQSDGEAKSLHTETHGGQNKEQILLTIKTFKKLCLKANTKKSNEIHDYYLNLEEILHETVNEESNELRLQLEENKKELEETNKKLKRKTRNKYEKCGRVYVGTDRKRSKVGSSKDYEERESNHKCSNVDFETVYTIECNNYKLTESIIKHLLKKFTVGSSSEWFDIDCEKLKDIVEAVVYIIDDVPSKSESAEQVSNVLTQLINDIPEKNIKLDKNTIKVKDDKIINQYFNKSVYENFINNHCELNYNYKEDTRNLITEFKSVLQNTEYKDKINILFFENDYTNFHGFLPKFRHEFFDNLSLILNTKLLNIKTKHFNEDGTVKFIHSKGLNGIRIKQKDIFNTDIYKNFFDTKLEKTNSITNTIQTKILLQTFMQYINDKKIKYIKAMIYSKNEKSGHGFIKEFKNEFFKFFIQYYNLSEERILLEINPRKSARGFYYMKIN